jgi:tryptophan synthase
LNLQLPDILARIREFTSVPLAVGFGVATRDHFNYIADAGADGVVIGSRLVNVISSSDPAKVAQNVEAYCRQVSGKDEPTRLRSPLATSTPTTDANSTSKKPKTIDREVLPARFGQFGGQYVPEALVDCLAELEEAHKNAMKDPEFWKEFHSHFGYINRPSNLYLAENLTKEAGGANIWLKREDLSVVLATTFPLLGLMGHFSNHTGSHKINNAIGQVRFSYSFYLTDGNQRHP